MVVCAVNEGLSPRVRGKPNDDRPPLGDFRSIPACAGEARRAYHLLAWYKVYPRVCGGSACHSPAVVFAPGLSPRVRGKPATLDARRRGRRSIPACAGEASAFRFRFVVIGVYPRVCGGSPHR